MLLFVRSKSTVVAAAALIALSWGAAAGLASADPPAPPPPGPAPGPPPGPAAGPPPGAPAPEAKTTIDHDGTFAVGTDIAPGIYSTAGPVANGTCYWKRTGNPDGELIDNAISKKPQGVRMEATDKAFKTDGCQPWQLTPDANPPNSAPPAGVQGTLGILNGLLGGQNGKQPPHS